MSTLWDRIKLLKVHMQNALDTKAGVHLNVQDTSDLLSALDTSRSSVPCLNTKEWAVQDAETGYYCPPRFLTYPAAVHYIVARSDFSDLRIVPAPPREMTDAECWAWYRLPRAGSAHELRLTGSAGGFCVWRPNWDAGYYEDPCDAIRAARRKLEAE